MLSQSNIDKLVLTGLYTHEIPKPNTGYGENPQWCKNWTFTVHEYNGKYIMRDTYWGTGESLSFELTDENFSDFTYMFDFNKVQKVKRDIWAEYDESKRFWAPTDSGGMYCGGSYFVLKDAKPSKALKRAILLDEIKDIKDRLGYKERELSRLDSDGIGGFYE